MMLRISAAAAACIGLMLAATFAAADGMPEPEDGFNPVPSVPAKPAPGIVQPPPIKETKPAPAPEPPKPAPAPAPATAPAPAPVTAPTSTPVTPPAPPAAPAADTTPAAQQKPIYEVQSVEVQVMERQPPIASITVKGTARTGGWKNVELKPLQTFAPEVGMRSYTLVGTPPSGPATQALTPVTATVQLDPLPADVKTIRVLGETNEVAQTFR
jgi:outer membrane biosynthesis protein TonB